MNESIYFFITKLIVFILTGVINILIARLFGPYGKGVFALFILDISIISMFIEGGMCNANIHFSGKNISEKNINNKLKSNTFLHLLVIIIISIIAAYTVSKYHKVNYVLYVFSLIFVSAETLLLRLFIVEVEPKKFNLCILVRIFLFLILIILLYKYITIVRLMFLWCITYGIELLIILFYLNKKQFKFILGIPLYFKTLWWGYQSQFGVLSQFLINRVSFYIISVLYNKQEVGLFSIAILVSETIWILPDSFRILLFRFKSDEMKMKETELTPLLIRTILILAIAVSAVYYIFMPKLIPFLFGRKFVKSIIYFTILQVGVIAMVPVRLISADILGRGRVKLVSAMTFIHFLILLVLYIIGGVYFSVKGIAFAYTIGNITIMFLYVYIYLNHTNISFRDIFIFKKEDFIKIKHIFKSNLNNLLRT